MREKRREKISPSKPRRKNKIVLALLREKGQSSSDDGGGQRHEIGSCLSSSCLGDTLSLYTYIYVYGRVKEREHQEWN